MYVMHERTLDSVRKSLILDFILHLTRKKMVDVFLVAKMSKYFFHVNVLFFKRLINVMYNCVVY